MKFTLPISPEYVQSWGLWEAFREIYQNALDEENTVLTYRPEQIEISSSGILLPSTLVLGNSNKRDDKTKRGKFGEGYKLALLVLSRLNHDVKIFTNGEVWTSKLEHDEQFNSTVLNIYVTKDECPKLAEQQDGVRFSIDGIHLEDWLALQKNIRATPAETEALSDPKEKGRIYVGGLYVSTAKDFHYGYSFPPNGVQLDRDRGMVDGFDLSYTTSAYWTARGGQLADKMLEAEAPDVRYVESHARAHSPIVTGYTYNFTKRHGHDAVPVSTQQEIEQATSAGIKWVLVPSAVKSLVGLVKSWFIPNHKKPVDRLRDFVKQHEYRLDNEMKRELNSIIESMEK